LTPGIADPSVPFVHDAARANCAERSRRRESRLTRADNEHRNPGGLSRFHYHLVHTFRLSGRFPILLW
jgi:hypothetical protein